MMLPALSVVHVSFGIAIASYDFRDHGAVQTRVGQGVLVGVFSAAVTAFFYFDLQAYFSLESLKSNRDAWLWFTEAHYTRTVLAFIAVYCIQTALSLPGATILTVTAGLLFGSVVGTMYAAIGATSGAVLAFLAARHVFQDRIERRFGDRVGPIQRRLALNGFSYILTLRLIPVVPFFVVNLLAGLTRVRLGSYVLATVIGTLPGSFVYANAGRRVGTMNSVSEIVSPEVMGALALLGILALVPSLYGRVRGRSARFGGDCEV